MAVSRSLPRAAFWPRRWTRQKIWHLASFAMLCGTAGLALLLVLMPEIGLPLFWGVIVPVLPAVLFFAPGVWRNLCPMARLNQLPREMRFTRGLTLPPVLAKYSLAISAILLLLFVSARKWLFDESGVATALLALAGLVAAFAGGYFFKGMSGWCSTFCPILPVERLYGQARFVPIKSAYCRPCIGCTRNCYNADPDKAAMQEQSTPGSLNARAYRIFAGLFPGFVLAFFTAAPEAALPELYLHFLFYSLLSLLAFLLASAVIKTPRTRVPALFGLLALNCYYWFAANTFWQSLSQLTGHWPIPDGAAWGIRGIIFVASAIWLVRLKENEALMAQT